MECGPIHQLFILLNQLSISSYLQSNPYAIWCLLTEKEEKRKESCKEFSCFYKNSTKYGFKMMY